jgi:predicted Zn-dependent protease
MTNPIGGNKEAYSKALSATNAAQSATNSAQIDRTVSDLKTALQDKLRHEQKWMALCERAAVEKDPKKLLELVSEINRLFQVRKEHLAKVPEVDVSGKSLR